MWVSRAAEVAGILLVVVLPAIMWLYMALDELLHWLGILDKDQVLFMKNKEKERKQDGKD